MPNEENARKFRALLLPELEAMLEKLGGSAQSSRLLFRALHKKCAVNFDELNFLKKTVHNYLSHNFILENLSLGSVKSSVDGTRKYQFITRDNHTIESVFIPYAAKAGRHTLCISSQVGCAMGCTFCATASLKLVRNLSACEIISQVYLVSRDIISRKDKASMVLSPNERPIHNIVFMGMGEPLNNFENVVRAIKLLSHSDGMGFSPQRITVSTSGLVPKIAELGEETGVGVAISLNATTNETRNIIMPVNRKWHINKLLEAARAYPLRVRERIIFEYVLLKNINDSPDDAERLVNLLKDMRCKVNLIPFNEHPFSPYKKPDSETISIFHAILYKARLSVFIRRTRGDDIDAACGMLGAQKLERERLEKSKALVAIP